MTDFASWYHAHIDAVSRSEGKSAVGLAAYMTGESLKDERTGLWCTRNHPGEVLDWGTTAPSFAPTYLTDENQLGKAWNDVERSEKRVDSHTANHWNVGSSREFAESDHIAVAQKMAEAITDRYGVMVTWAVHKPTDHGSDDNWHIHLGYNMRRVTEDGFGEKAREITAKQTRVEETIWQRKMIADVLNDRLELVGSDERVSHETYARQGKNQEPKKHLGNEANQLELKGVRTEIGDHNREVEERNRQRLEDRTEFVAQTDAQLQARLEQQMSDVVEPKVDQATAEPQVDNTVRALQADKKLADQVASAKQMEAIKEKLDAHARETEKAAKQAQADQDERRKADDRRAAEGGITSAQSRYAEALGNTYDMRRPYASLANAAMAEHGMYKREQQDLRKRAAAEPNPAKRKLLETNAEIQHCDYMVITSERLASMSETIVGRSDTPEAIRQREQAAEFRDKSRKLRGQFSEGHQAQQKEERQVVAEKLGDLAKEVGRGHAGQRGAETIGNAMHTQTAAQRRVMEAKIAAAEKENGQEAVVAKQTEEQGKRAGLKVDQPTEGTAPNAAARAADNRTQDDKSAGMKSHAELTGKAAPGNSGPARPSGGGRGSR